MQRSKQQAMFFVLGAVLVGGALGFTADRMFGSDDHRSWAPRERMYNDLALTEAQRLKADSLLDEQNCQIQQVMKPVRPILDSIRGNGRKAFETIMTPEQLTIMETRRGEMVRRDSLEKARRDSVAATKKTLVTCRN
jgi:hypothetical protein